MTEKLIHLDIVSLIFLTIILISQLSRKMYKGSTNKFFLSLLILTMLSSYNAQRAHRYMECCA